MEERSLKLCKRIKNTEIQIPEKNVFNDYAKSGTSQLWDQFLPFHSLFLVSFISCGPGLEKVVRLFFFFFFFLFQKRKAAATGSCCVTYVPEGVNTSLSAHQILWELGLMFLAFKTCFLFYWAKGKILVVQTHTHAVYLTLYCNYVTTFLKPRDLWRSKLTRWREERGLRGGGGTHKVLECGDSVHSQSSHGWHMPIHTD